MKPNPKFVTQTSPEFWANVKYISQRLGYTDRKTKSIKVYPFELMIALYKTNNFQINKIAFSNETPTDFGQLLLDYFDYRANALNNYVQHNLMDLEEAKALYEDLCTKHNPICESPYE